MSLNDCPRCGHPVHLDADSVLDQPVRRTHERDYRHYECRLREQWDEWKRIVADYNDIDVDNITFA